MYRGGAYLQLYSSSTSSLDGIRTQRHVPAALPPGKTKYAL